MASLACKIHIHVYEIIPSKYYSYSYLEFSKAVILPYSLKCVFPYFVQQGRLQFLFLRFSSVFPKGLKHSMVIPEHVKFTAAAKQLGQTAHRGTLTCGLN